MRTRHKPLTMVQLVKQKKDLIKRRNASPDAAELDQALEKIELELLARIKKNDQTFRGTFLKVAQEELDPDVFDRILNVASTRQHNYATSQRCN